MQQKSLDDQHPDRMRTKARALASGTEAMRFVDAVNAMSFDIDDGLSHIAALRGHHLASQCNLSDALAA
ncbi:MULTISPECIES: hypothetical protein [unclassified Bradyrhizobium]|uniref:hypothetical protein n=1 Tax=unclassified Bradyrhizobium TaxID=2631580 RepID=UPI00291630BB|nr:MULTISPECIES: hypothetical protein [unclassified Bradyrhizobium]